VTRSGCLLWGCSRDSGFGSVEDVRRGVGDAGDSLQMRGFASGSGGCAAMSVRAANELDFGKDSAAFDTGGF
jgi:hypothetical protein